MHHSNQGQYVYLLGMLIGKPHRTTTALQDHRRHFSSDPVSDESQKAFVNSFKHDNDVIVVKKIKNGGGGRLVNK